MQVCEAITAFSRRELRATGPLILVTVPRCPGPLAILSRPIQLSYSLAGKGKKRNQPHEACHLTERHTPEINTVIYLSWLTCAIVFSLCPVPLCVLLQYVIDRLPFSLTRSFSWHKGSSNVANMAEQIAPNSPGFFQL